MDMRKRFLESLAPLTLLLMFCTSCAWLDGKQEGYISLRVVTESFTPSKAVSDIPDTNDFILTVTKSDGTVVYSGLYGASPESLLVKSGTYDVKLVSSEFSKPQFDAPQYGDEQCVVVNPGAVAKVEMVCRQMNSGMKLKVAPEFLTAYPQASLFLKSNDGKLLYAYRETRIAYFKPGSVSLVLNEGASETTLLTKTLESQEILTLNVSVSASSSGGSSAASGGISVSVDTTRNYVSDSFVIGGSGAGGDDMESALSVSDAKNNVGKTGVWVTGYIVGGDMTSSSTGISFSTPFSSSTHLAIASKSSVTTKASCMSVQLPSGAIRAALNLVDNPTNLGKKVYIKGDIVSSYYGLPGIKNISDFKLK